MSSEYEALVAKVDDWLGAIAARRGASLGCHPGCSACCEVHLELSPVEAVTVADALGRLGPEELRQLGAQLARVPDDPRCSLLTDSGACLVYQARPLVCRTQGHALRYEEGLIPEEALRARAGGDVTWCPLCYIEQPPGSGDIVDAERVDALLGLVNLRACDARGADPAARIALRQLALDALELLGPVG